MCLRVFTEGDQVLFDQLKPASMKLGAAFQKVNFLRDLKNDYQDLGRVYFPKVTLSDFSGAEKKQIEADIQCDFDAALEGIRCLPASSRFGVYVAYVYYKALFNKIKSVPPSGMLTERIRVSNYHKVGLLAGSYFKHSFRML